MLKIGSSIAIIIIIIILQAYPPEHGHHPSTKQAGHTVTYDTIRYDTIRYRVTIRPGFPGHVLFLTFVRASGRVFENRRFVRVFSQIRK